MSPSLKSTKPTARLNAVFLEHLHSTEVRVFLWSAAAGSSRIQMSVWNTHLSCLQLESKQQRDAQHFCLTSTVQTHAEVKLHAHARYEDETWGLVWHEMHVFICVLYFLTLTKQVLTGFMVLWYWLLCWYHIHKQ